MQRCVVIARRYDVFVDHADRACAEIRQGATVDVQEVFAQYTLESIGQARQRRRRRRRRRRRAQRATPRSRRRWFAVSVRLFSTLSSRPPGV